MERFRIGLCLLVAALVAAAAMSLSCKYIPCECEDVGTNCDADVEGDGGADGGGDALQ